MSYISTAIIAALCICVSMFTYAEEANRAQLSHEEIVIPTKDDFPLSADYFFGAADGAGVLLLHSCKSSRKVNFSLGETLAQYNHHVLSLDFRGYGNSISEKFSHNSIKHQAQDIVSYQAQMLKLTGYWHGDIIAAHQYLSTRMNNNQSISVVAIGCATEAAIALAEQTRLTALVVVSPKISDIEQERYKNLLDFPTYFIASTHDTESYNIADELFQWNGDKNSKFQSFKGNRSGSLILKRNTEVAQDIALWLRSRSRK